MSSTDSGDDAWVPETENASISQSSSTLYAVLGVEITASQRRIRTAYKQLAKRYHPDRNHGNPEAVDKFQTIQNAYEVLSNEQKRSYYDLNMLLYQLDVEEYLHLFQGLILTVCGLGMSSRRGAATHSDNPAPPYPHVLPLHMP